MFSKTKTECSAPTLPFDCRAAQSLANLVVMIVIRSLASGQKLTDGIPRAGLELGTMVLLGAIRHGVSESDRITRK